MVPGCGDGIINTSSEACDGSNLGGETCASATGGSSVGGTLACLPDCSDFDYSACYETISFSAICKASYWTAQGFIATGDSFSYLWEGVNPPHHGDYIGKRLVITSGPYAGDYTITGFVMRASNNIYTPDLTPFTWRICPILSRTDFGLPAGCQSTTIPAHLYMIY